MKTAYQYLLSCRFLTVKTPVDFLLPPPSGINKAGPVCVWLELVRLKQKIGCVKAEETIASNTKFALYFRFQRKLRKVKTNLGKELAGECFVSFFKRSASCKFTTASLLWNINYTEINVNKIPTKLVVCACGWKCWHRLIEAENMWCKSRGDDIASTTKLAVYFRFDLSQLPEKTSILKFGNEQAGGSFVSKT